MKRWLTEGSTWDSRGVIYPTSFPQSLGPFPMLMTFFLFFFLAVPSHSLHLPQNRSHCRLSPMAIALPVEFQYLTCVSTFHPTPRPLASLILTVLRSAGTSSMLALLCCARSLTHPHRGISHY